jgi:hypothetical protein
MEADLKANLRAVEAAFREKSELAASTIWARAVKDGRFMERLESGKGFTIRTYDTAMLWFSSNWPAGAEWPSHVARPAPAEGAAA